MSVTVTVDGVERTYRLATPATGPADRPRPLILLFHGFNGSGDQIAQLTALSDRGASSGAIVAAPDGTAGTWGLSPTGADARFVDALVERTERDRCVDESRVFTTGFSAGAAFAILYSCARQDQIAAIATVAVEFQLGCGEPQSIMAFHGTEDPAVPYQDGAVGASLPGKVRGTDRNMGDWARLGGCSPTPERDRLGTEVVRETWPRCRRGTEVVLVRIDGGGHTWPGASSPNGAGLTTQQVGATDEILAFFARHHLPA